MTISRILTCPVFAIGVLAAQAPASITITQGASAPTYSGHHLNFDEPGTPTGVVSPDTWAVSHGITELQAGDGVPVVDNFTADLPWVGSGNSFFGNFGVFMSFSQGVTEMSFQAWDPSGPPSPFGGGFAVLIVDADENILASYSGEPAWGGIGDSWINITADGGDTFDDVRVLGFGFFPTTYVDDLSWNTIPEPTSAALLALGALAVVRRRTR
jgi:hypothetical protein